MGSAAMLVLTPPIPSEHKSQLVGTFPQPTKLSAVAIWPYTQAPGGRVATRAPFGTHVSRFRNGFCGRDTIRSVPNVVAEDEKNVRVYRKDYAENYGFSSIIIIIGTSNFNIAAICCERKISLFLIPPFVFFARFSGSVSLVVISQAPQRRFAGQLSTRRNEQ